ncbi:MAG: hypothetical protein M1818_006284 [Claussenomyces sp. TS43310]|nr:MAG: hypothetical protein M1818_006284 [Claussenomyces sp. TS43310]
MSEGKLDQIVKGAPPSSIDITPTPTSGVNEASSSPTDPLASLPSSPPQIYLNLLILEASLRAQYLELHARRRQYTFFLALLFLWTLYFGYALFLAPREDGSGVGGSVYWVVEVTEKVALMGGIVTGILVWGTGQWERGIRWPRRWVGITNRGLRGFNCKVVVVKKTWWRELVDLVRFFLSGGVFRVVGPSSYHYIDSGLLSRIERESKGGLSQIREEDAAGRIGRRGQEEDLAPGGDTISLLLLPKPFSPAFRENWDLYRNEYWERENARRAQIRERLQAYEKAALEKQRAQEGWLAWLLFWRRGKRRGDIEKSHHGHGASLQNKHGAYAGPEKRLRSGSNALRPGSNSRNSSRGSTPALEAEDGKGSTRTRRSSTASSGSASPRKKRERERAPTATRSGSTSSSGARMQKLTPAGATGSRATTPASDAEREGRPLRGSPLVRKNSLNSVSSLDISPEESVGRDGENLRSASRASSATGTSRSSRRLAAEGKAG